MNMDDEQMVDERNGPPWEDRPNLGILVAFARTVEQSALKPVTFFRTLRLKNNVMDAALFGIGIVSITTFVQLLWTAMLAPLPFLFLGEFAGISIPEVASMAAWSWAKFILSPLIASVSLFILAGLVHLGLTLLGAAGQPFETTFRVLCYASTPLLLLLVPFCGELAGKVWMLIILVIGIRECHGTSTTQSLIAVLTPVFLFLGCCGALFGAFAITALR